MGVDETETRVLRYVYVWGLQPAMWKVQFIHLFCCPLLLALGLSILPYSGLSMPSGEGSMENTHSSNPFMYLY